MTAAEEHFEQTIGAAYFSHELTKEDIIIEMQNFAKLHVEAALQSASEKVELKGGNISTCNTIINAYPLNNIK